MCNLCKCKERIREKMFAAGANDDAAQAVSNRWFVLTKLDGFKSFMSQLPSAAFTDEMPPPPPALIHAWVAEHAPGPDDLVIDVREVSDSGDGVEGWDVRIGPTPEAAARMMPGGIAGDFRFGGGDNGTRH